MAWPHRSAFLLRSYLLCFDDVFGARFQYHSILSSPRISYLSALDCGRNLRDPHCLAPPLGVDLESRADSEPDFRSRFFWQHLESAAGSADVLFPPVHLLVCSQIDLDSTGSICSVDCNCSVAAAPRRPC